MSKAASKVQGGREKIPISPFFDYHFSLNLCCSSDDLGDSGR